MIFYILVFLWVNITGWVIGAIFWECIEEEKNYKAFLCVVVSILISVLLGWFFAYRQQNTIKKCYYNGVSVKVDSLYISNGVGKIIEPDSTFYINK